VVSSRPPNLQKTKEKLKNPQQPNTQAPESQEGLKRHVDAADGEELPVRPESQEGLKQDVKYKYASNPIIINAQNLKKG